VNRQIPKMGGHVLAENDKIRMADLTTMTLAELKSLEKKVAKAIVKVEQQEKKKALSELEAKAKEMGFSLSELTGAGKGPRGGGKSKGAAKYANPSDPSQTWTGRGRRPAWVIEALNAGKSIDDLEI